MLLEKPRAEHRRSMQTQKSSRKSRRVQLTYHRKVLGALANPNSVTSDLNKPNRVRKAVRYSSPSDLVECGNDIELRKLAAGLANSL